MEYEDEFGRQRTARRSEIPRHLLPPDPNDEPEEDIECVSSSLSLHAYVRAERGVRPVHM